MVDVKTAMTFLGFAAITMVAVGILLAVGASVTQNVHDQQTEGRTLTNESVVIPADALTYDHSFTTGGASPVTAIIFVANNTRVIPAANYSLVTNTSGQFILFALSANADVDGFTYNTTYSYTGETTPSIAAGNATEGAGQFATQLPNLGVAAGAAVLIMIIFGAMLGMFRMKGGRRE